MFQEIDPIETVSYGRTNVGWGTYDKLTERGELLVEKFAEEEFETFLLFLVSWNGGPFVTLTRPLPSFQVKSLYTGAEDVPLKAHWMDLDDNGNLLEGKLA